MSTVLRLDLPHSQIAFQNCAILVFAAIATRVVSDHLSPALAARDLCVELICPPTSAAASLSPYYHPLPPEVKVTTTVLEDEVLRRIASALMIFLGRLTSYLSQSRLPVCARHQVGGFD